MIMITGDCLPKQSFSSGLQKMGVSEIVVKLSNFQTLYWAMYANTANTSLHKWYLKAKPFKIDRKGLKAYMRKAKANSITIVGINTGTF